ncbi:histidine phosphatase family protein [Enterococcus gilvus]|uniref:histidine phosphatase family protein n=1 Tax=Enterococcus gilvus TaxID=160453 RepID=UPI0028D519AF|nr:histidine phosphatase family protein [Enterococcus gilvus]
MNKKLKLFISMLLVSLLCFVSTTNIAATTHRTKEGVVVLYITRHGKTMFNTVHRAQGWADTPLTPEGCEVATKLGVGLKERKIFFTEAYSSDSGRARETAKLILKNNGQSNLNIKERKDLREVCFGNFEGELDEVMWGAVGKELGYDSYDNYMSAISSGEASVSEMLEVFKKLDTSGNSEDWNTTRKRMEKELKTISERAAQNGGGKILIVSHGMAILSLISDMTNEKPEGGQLSNASVTKIVYKNGRFFVKEIGNMNYIKTSE